MIDTLLNHELFKLADVMQEENFTASRIIIKQGHIGDKFYIIKQGTAKVIESGQLKRELKPGDYFGERSLLIDEPRSATIQASTDMILYTLTSDKFMQVIQPLTDILQRNMTQLGIDQVSPQKTFQNAVKTGITCKGIDESSSICKLDELEKVGLIGVGGFGVVHLVQDSFSKKHYALKSVRKDIVVWHKHEHQIQAELKIMKLVRQSNFIITLFKTFKDRYQVHFLLEAAMGGDLFHYMSNLPHALPNNQAMFYAACVIEGLNHIHSFEIVYRDIKPENLIITKQGYLKIADFGLSKYLPGHAKTFTLCGTPEYLAPEIILGRGYDTSVDWWSVGILIYEMLTKVPPFVGSPEMVCEKILTKQPKFSYLVSKEARDLITQFLNKNPSDRLQKREQIMNHSWFDNFDWISLRNCTMQAPYIPQVKSAKDLSNFHISLKPDASIPTAIDNAEWAEEF